MASIVQRGEMWYVAWRDGNRQRRKSLKTTSRKEAQRLLKQWKKLEREAELRGIHGEASCDCTPSKFWMAYSKWAKQTKRSTTQYTEVIHWRQFLEEFGPTRFGDVSSQDVEDMKARWIDLGKAPKTINGFLTNCRMFYNWAKGLNKRARIDPLYTGENPFSRIARVEDHAKERPFLDASQCDGLLEVAKTQGQDIYLFCALGLHAGLRKSEAIAAQWSWISWKRKTITVTRGDGFIPKSGRNRTIPLKDSLARILKPAKLDSGYILAPDKPSGNRYRYEPRYSFQKVAAEAGFDWLSPHLLRHSFASNLAIAGVSLYKIANWLGHSNEDVTKLYAHLQEHDEDINRL